jgi:hypothetical protein
VFFVQWFSSSPRIQNCWTRFRQQGINTAFLTWCVLEVKLVKWLDIKKNYTNRRMSRERSIYILFSSAFVLAYHWRHVLQKLPTLVIWSPSDESETDCTEGRPVVPKISLYVFLNVFGGWWQLVSFAKYSCFFCCLLFALHYHFPVFFMPISYFFMLCFRVLLCVAVPYLARKQTSFS